MDEPLTGEEILCLRNNENGIVKYTIRDEIGRGGSCIVYDAFYSNNINEERTVRIKECYPCKLKINRLENGELISEEQDSLEFEKSKERIIDSFRRNNQLFNDTSLTNSVSNTLDVYKANNTIYIVSTYQAGNILSKERITSLQDAVEIVKAVAETVNKIHDSGFLYLDIKPSNIYVYNGTTKAVQLFDFDSLIPIDALGSESIEKYRISYSSGFAALEQKTANVKRIGKHTDVFAVGALLFYLLLGHTPTAFDSEVDATYEYDQGRFQTFQYQDKLFRELTDFFHKSIASYYADRYKDLNDVVKKLEIIARLSDVEQPFIFSTPIIVKKELVGRETEVEQINDYLQTNKCLFVTGMGGIGKSSLVRKYASLHNEGFDNIIYLYHQGDTIKLITDDDRLHINTVQKATEETAEEYFRRKTQVLRKILKETPTLLIIDNFLGEIDKTLLSVFSLGWKVIVISREEAPSDEYPQIKIGAIKKREDLYRLFELYLKRGLVDEEYPFIDKIIDEVSGHSLVLELIAKQLLKSYISIEQACSIVVENGFSEIAPEKIEYEKDSITSSETIQNIISKLFPSERYGNEYKIILKGLSLFDAKGIQITTFSEMLALHSLDSINELISDQWIEKNGDYISLHSVIREVINTWKWDKEYKNAALDIVKYYFTRLKLEGQREEIPADHLQIIKILKEALDSKNIITKWQFERIRKKNLIGEIFIQRVERGGEEAITNRNLVAQLLSEAEVVIHNCSRIEDINDTDLYKSLIYQLIIKLPKDREEYVLQRCLELLDDGFIKPDARYDLYDRVVTIYSGRQNYKRAWEIIQKAKRGLALKSSKVKGLYYDFLAEFYDAKLPAHAE